MTLEQAARQALEALEANMQDERVGQWRQMDEAAIALREALAQPQEPVLRAYINAEGKLIHQNLYAAPPVVQQEPAKVQSDCTIAATISKTETVAPYLNQWVLRECYYDDEGEVTMHRAPKENK